MSTRNFLEGRCGRCVGLTTLQPSCADCLEIWEPQTPGTLRACPGLHWVCFTFISFVSSRRCYNARSGGRLSGYGLYRCFPNFLLTDPFCLRLIKMDPHTLPHLNMVCPDDRCPNLKMYLGADKSLARSTSRYILFDG